MRLVKPVLALSLLFGFSTAAQAEDLQFLLINTTRHAITGVQVSTVSTNSWEENLIAGYVLPAGNEVDVVIADGARVCEYDLLLTFQDGDSIDDRNVDLCSLGSYTARE